MATVSPGDTELAMALERLVAKLPPGRAKRRYETVLADLSLAESVAGLSDNQGDPLFPDGQHWVYRVWSRVLDAEVWWAHCQTELADLLSKGIPRGAIYTESELRELLNLPHPRQEALRRIHVVKAYFDGTFVEVKTGAEESLKLRDSEVHKKSAAMP